MKDNFNVCFEELMVLEGGYANLPGDTGGETMWGISTPTYQGWCKKKGITPKPIKELTKPEAKQIYLEEFWSAIKGDFLPRGIDFVIFDFVVHAGTTNPIRICQEMIGAVVDGVFGNQTLAKLLEYITIKKNKPYSQEKMRKFINDFSTARRNYTLPLDVYANWPDGMENRFKNSRHAALDMLGEERSLLGDIKQTQPIKALTRPKATIASMIGLLYDGVFREIVNEALGWELDPMPDAIAMALAGQIMTYIGSRGWEKIKGVEK